MNDKSYVPMEQHICPVCGKTFDTGALLLDRRLQERFGRHTATEYSLCPEHQKLADDGYVALIEIDPERSPPPYKLWDVHRTGPIEFVKRDVLERITDVDEDTIFVFVEIGVIERLSANENE